jgi:hypothetical protein
MLVELIKWCIIHNKKAKRIPMWLFILAISIYSSTCTCKTNLTYNLNVNLASEVDWSRHRN